MYVVLPNGIFCQIWAEMELSTEWSVASAAVNIYIMKLLACTTGVGCATCSEERDDVELVPFTLLDHTVYLLD